jgi:predicted RNA-binding protein with PIN domain
MKILNNIRALFSSPGRSDEGLDGSVAIIDGQSLTRSPGGDRSAPPRDRIALLNRLASFAEKEQISVIALFSGSPLRIAGDNERYRGVVVKYTGEGGDVAESMVRILKEGRIGKKAVVITSDQDVARAVSAVGAQVMFASTFKRAIDAAEPQVAHHGPRAQETRNHARPAEEEDDGDRIVKELIDPL